MLRNARKDHFSNLISTNSNNSRVLFSTIDSLINRVGYREPVPIWNRFQYNRYLPGPKCNADFGASFRHLSDTTVAMKTPMSVSATGQSLHWELGQFYMCPTESA